MSCCRHPGKPTVIFGNQQTPTIVDIFWDLESKWSSILLLHKFVKWEHIVYTYIRMRIYVLSLLENIGFSDSSVWKKQVCLCWRFGQGTLTFFRAKMKRVGIWVFRCSYLTCIGRACMDNPPPKQVRGSLHDWLGQDWQGVASKEGYPHPAESQIPQERWRSELPRCWMAALKDTRSKPNQRPHAPTDSSSDSIWWDARLYNDKCFILASSSPCRRSEYPDRNVGKDKSNFILKYVKAGTSRVVLHSILYSSTLLLMHHWKYTIIVAQKGIEGDARDYKLNSTSSLTCCGTHDQHCNTNPFAKTCMQVTNTTSVRQLLQGLHALR